ncbi:hypothetical protein VULLAG_LOCUS18559 [Vulpes lagopus]
MYPRRHCDTYTCKVISGPRPQLARLAGVLIEDILILFTGCTGPTTADFSLPDHLRLSLYFHISHMPLETLYFQILHIPEPWLEENPVTVSPGPQGSQQK